MSRAGLRHAVAISASVLSAASVFAALASAESSSGPAGQWGRFPMLLLPAVLVGLLVVAFVLLPLWTFFAAAQSSARLRFALVAAAIWTLVSVAGAAITGADTQETLRGLPALLLPGWALIAVFGVLAEKRGLAAPNPRRSDGPQALSAPAGREASPRALAPAAAPKPGSATTGD
jgi:hypothetical protein